MHARTLAAFIAVTLIASSAAADDTAHKVMDRWVGSWTGNAAGAASQIVAAPDHAEAAWTLNNQFVMGTNFDASGKPVAVWLMHHNDKTSNFEVYFFASDGGIGEWIGTWSEPEGSMNWTGKDATGAKLTGYTRINADRQEWKLQFDDNGTIRTDAGSLTRKK